jgi:GNAT superfamily N-acetyltransferase
VTARPALVVRDARPDEHEAVRALTLRAYAEYAAVMTPGAWAGLERAVRSALEAEGRAASGGDGGDAAFPAQRLVALDGDAVAGTVLLYPPAADAYGGAAERTPWPEVRLLAVPPERRGTGVGQLLMDECVRRARAAGATTLGLHTSRSLAAAVRMYQRMGFVRAPEHDFQPPGAEVVEAYRLEL